MKGVIDPTTAAADAAANAKAIFRQQCVSTRAKPTSAIEAANYVQMSIACVVDTVSDGLLAAAKSILGLAKQ